MFGKLRANYRLSNILVRILFVLTFAFCTWQDYLGVVNSLYLSEMTAYLNGTGKLFIALASALLLGTALMFLLPVLTNAFLNIARIQSVPRAEYCLLTHLYFAIGFFICGLLNLINLITPVFMVWGRIIFPFVVSVGCGISFYRVTAKLYFNDVTVLNYFKHLLIAFAIVLVVVGVAL
ncbi:MAG: hypothetical protein NC099_03440 [Corallococcus sp.]|nr:hypothetical protein [Bacillota bacterium]MCM1533687.1 hypothetical protein [Corallococcus sp.]